MVNSDKQPSSRSQINKLYEKFAFVEQRWDKHTIGYLAIAAIARYLLVGLFMACMLGAFALLSMHVFANNRDISGDFSHDETTTSDTTTTTTTSETTTSVTYVSYAISRVTDDTTDTSEITTTTEETTTTKVCTAVQTTTTPKPTTTTSTTTTTTTTAPETVVTSISESASETVPTTTVATSAPQLTYLGNFRGTYYRGASNPCRGGSGRTLIDCSYGDGTVKGSVAARYIYRNYGYNVNGRTKVWIECSSYPSLTGWYYVDDCCASNSVVDFYFPVYSRCPFQNAGVISVKMYI